MKIYIIIIIIVTLFPADLLGSLTAVRLFSPPQWRNTAEERAGPFQQVWPPVNFMLACLKLLDCDAKSSGNMLQALQNETTSRHIKISNYANANAMCICIRISQDGRQARTRKTITKEMRNSSD